MPTPAGSRCVQGKGGSAGAPHQEYACCSASPRPGVRPAGPHSPTRGTRCLLAFIFHFWFEWLLLSFFLVLF